jgi:hypothetical protein
MNNKCKLINTVWIDKGIILSILYYIIINYKKLRKNTIIINNENYLIFFKYIFPKLIFSKYEHDNELNFYFNIRNIIKKQDIIFDYLNNYDNYIHTKKIRLVPWYDLNDILIMYKYDSDHTINAKKDKKKFLSFSKCERGNYKKIGWDLFCEQKILNSYFDLDDKYTISDLNNFFNNFIKTNYTDTVRVIKKKIKVPVQVPIHVPIHVPMQIPVQIPTQPTKEIKVYPEITYVDYKKDLNYEKLNEETINKLSKCEKSNEENINKILQYQNDIKNIEDKLLENIFNDITAMLSLIKIRT